ncbi:MAG TPA: nitroreductase family protein, partial [Actinomycetota bacterium]|nr:nitroreductase family protein [Actinomycetota bacterium]
VPNEVVARAVEAAGTAPAPHGSRGARPWRFVWLRSSDPRDVFLSALREQWRADLQGDGLDDETVSRRIEKSDQILEAAPVLIACFVSPAATDHYTDERRARAERDMFVAAGGAAVQNLMIALAAQSVGSCWISSSLFAPEVAARALDLGPEWQALGCVAAGYASEPPAARRAAGSQDLLDIR